MLILGVKPDEPIEEERLEIYIMMIEKAFGSKRLKELLAEKVMYMEEIKNMFIKVIEDLFKYIDYLEWKIKKIEEDIERLKKDKEVDFNAEKSISDMRGRDK